MNKALFLDRDGILNRVVMRGGVVSSPWTVDELELIDDARSLVKHAKENQFLTIVVTNQPDVARGTLDAGELSRMHERLLEWFDLDRIEVCTSADNTDPRRKPNPGMLIEAGTNYNIELGKSFLVGDGERDIIAGRKAGVKTVLLQTPYNKSIHGTADFNCNSLSEVHQIVSPDFSARFLDESKQIIERFPAGAIDDAARVLRKTREAGGRLFIVGSGGGAGHASHATCDFRRLCGFEAYAPADNVSELTARINDEGWNTSISNYLLGSRLSSKDCVLIFSVGGGSEKPAISMNLVNAVKAAKGVRASVVGIVGRDGGFTARNADACVVIPTVNSDRITPHTEAFQALVWHLLVSHPLLQVNRTKWESEVSER